MMLT
jgi:CheY-like chemotaxis protein